MACKANCCCCKCTKKTKRHKRNKKTISNGRRPFAPLFSTSTISKAVNSVYGPPMPITRTSYMPGEHRGGPPELKPEIALSFRETPLTNHPELGSAFESLERRHGGDRTEQSTRGAGFDNAANTGEGHVMPHTNNHDDVDFVVASSGVPGSETPRLRRSARLKVAQSGTDGITLDVNNLPTMIGPNGRATTDYGGMYQATLGVDYMPRKTPPSFMRPPSGSESESAVASLQPGIPGQGFSQYPPPSPSEASTSATWYTALTPRKALLSFAEIIAPSPKAKEKVESGEDSD